MVFLIVFDNYENYPPLLLPFQILFDGVMGIDHSMTHVASLMPYVVGVCMS